MGNSMTCKSALEIRDEYKETIRRINNSQKK